MRSNHCFWQPQEEKAFTTFNHDSLRDEELALLEKINLFNNNVKSDFKKLRKLFSSIKNSHDFLHLVTLSAKNPVLTKIILSKELEPFWDKMIKSNSSQPPLLHFPMTIKPQTNLSSVLKDEGVTTRHNFHVLAGLWCNSYFRQLQDDKNKTNAIIQATTEQRYSEAATLLTTLPKYHSQDWRRSTLLAYNYFMLGGSYQYKAISILRDTSNKNPNNVFLLKLFLFANYTVGKIDGCEKAMQSLSMIDSNFQDGYYFISVLNYNNNRLKAASDWLSQFQSSNSIDHQLLNAVIMLTRIINNTITKENIDQALNQVLKCTADIATNKKHNHHLKVYCIYLMLSQFFKSVNNIDSSQYWEKKAISHLGGKKYLPSYKCLMALSFAEITRFLIQLPIQEHGTAFSLAILKCTISYFENLSHSLNEKSKELLQIGELMGDYSSIEALNLKDRIKINNMRLDNKIPNKEDLDNIIQRVERATKLHGASGYGILAKTYFSIANSFHHIYMKQRVLIFSTLSEEYFKKTIEAINKSISLEPYCKDIINNAHYGFGIENSAAIIEGITNLREMKTFYIKNTPHQYKNCSQELINPQCRSA